MWRLIVAESLSGAPVLEVSHLVLSGSWERKLNGFGSGRFDLFLPGSGLSRSEHRFLFRPWRHTLYLLRGEQVIASGWILGAGFNPDTGVLSVRHAEFRAIFQHRLMYRAADYDTGSREVYDLDAASVARWYIAQTFLDNADPRANLPIEGSFYDDGTIRRTVFNYQAKTLETVLTEMQDFDGGPDLDFRPLRKASGLFFHEQRIGRPRLLGPAYDIIPGAESHDAEITGTDLDASKQVTEVLTIGEGSEFKQTHGSASEVTVLDSGLPVLTRVESFKSAFEQDELDGHARSIRDTYRTPTESWGVRLRASGFPGVEPLTPGVRLRVLFPGNEWDFPGWREAYVTGFSGSWGEDIDVSIQEVA